MAPNFKTTTLAHYRLSLLSDNNNMAWSFVSKYEQVSTYVSCKTHAGWQNLSKYVNKFKKGPQIRCIPRGRWGLALCKSTCEEDAGSDISFENITLCLDQLPLKIQFAKEKRTLKTLVLSREANTLPQYKSSCKEQASSHNNLSVKP